MYKEWGQVVERELREMSEVVVAQRRFQVSGFRFQVEEGREKKMAKVQKFEELKIWQIARVIATCIP